MPEHVVVERHSHLHQPLAVIDQQPDLKLGARQRSARQLVYAFAKRGARHGDGVDLIGLSALAAAASFTGHQPRGDPDDSFAVDQKKPLKGPRHVPAVLKRPDPLITQAPRPIQRRAKAALTDSHRLATKQLTVPGTTAANVCEPLCMSAPTTIVSVVPFLLI